MEKKAAELMTAQEARKLASSSQVLIKRISKVIKDYAAEGHTRLVWDTDDLSGDALDNLKNYLKSKGYEVTIKSELYDSEEEAVSGGHYRIYIAW